MSTPPPPPPPPPLANGGNYVPPPFVARAQGGPAAAPAPSPHEVHAVYGGHAPALSPLQGSPPSTPAASPHGAQGAHAAWHGAGHAVPLMVQFRPRTDRALLFAQQRAVELLTVHGEVLTPSWVRGYEDPRLKLRKLDAAGSRWAAAYYRLHDLELRDVPETTMESIRIKNVPTVLVESSLPHGYLFAVQYDGAVYRVAPSTKQMRRKAANLPPAERWDCPRGCGQVYARSSSNSIKRHLKECTFGDR